MKKIAHLIGLTILLSYFSLAHADSASGPPEGATLEFKTKDKEKTLKFSYHELQQARKNVSIVFDKLEASGVSCCEPRQKISKCIYECCDGSQARTCDKTLGAALLDIPHL